ncbi:hypothetical protein [Shewanella glacialipiscicola]|uniref:hypothetical protein n=1 Tax=Shewanella glacialipiscicola TaxID=614069 RepID=UPI003D7AFD5B
MQIVKLLIFTISCVFISSCANISYHLGSVASFTEDPKFDPNKTYTYYDKTVSNTLVFDEFEIMVSPYNSVKTNGHFELFFIPVEQQGSNAGSVGQTPFLVSISVKGALNTTKFIPFESVLNEDIGVELVKWRDPKPSCDYHYTDWIILETNIIHLVKDRQRNQGQKCMKQGWVEYLLVFDFKTPKPTERFSLDLSFQNIKTNQIMNKKLFFSGAKFVSTQTH